MESSDVMKLILTDLYSQGFYKNTTRCDETLRRDLFNEAESLKDNYDTVNDVIRLSPKLLERLLNEPVVREMLLTLNNTWGTYAIQDVHYHYRYSFEETGSGFWHRDGGGHKYKFLILDQIGETTKTALLPTSHSLVPSAAGKTFIHLCNRLGFPILCIKS